MLSFPKTLTSQGVYAIHMYCFKSQLNWRNMHITMSKNIQWSNKTKPIRDR